MLSPNLKKSKFEVPEQLKILNCPNSGMARLNCNIPITLIYPNILSKEAGNWLKCQFQKAWQNKTHKIHSWFRSIFDNFWPYILPDVIPEFLHMQNITQSNIHLFWHSDSDTFWAKHGQWISGMQASCMHSTCGCSSRLRFTPHWFSSL